MKYGTGYKYDADLAWGETVSSFTDETSTTLSYFYADLFGSGYFGEGFFGSGEVSTVTYSPESATTITYT